LDEIEGAFVMANRSKSDYYSPGQRAFAGFQPIPDGYVGSLMSHTVKPRALKLILDK